MAAPPVGAQEERAAEGAEEGAGEEEVAEPTGPILVGGISVPVLQGDRVRMYEYGMIALHVGDTMGHLSQVCGKQFELVDAFLTYLHTNPFPTSSEQDGPAAEREMLSMAKEMVGAGIITGIQVVWSPTPFAPGTTMIGNIQSVPCPDVAAVEGAEG